MSTPFEQVEHLVNMTILEDMPRFCYQILGLVMNNTTPEKLAELVVNQFSESELEEFCDTINDLGVT